jgi:L-fuconolactonase
VLKVFGAERLLFGSDWPVCLVAGSYGRVLVATKELLSALTEPERASVFGGTARRCYRIRDAVIDGVR